MRLWLLTAVLLIPTIGAQVSLPDDRVDLAYDGTTSTVSGTTVVSCLDVITAGGQLTPTASSAAPGWLDVSATATSVSATDCVGQLEAEAALTVTIGAKPGAPGMNLAEVQITVGDASDTFPARVQYLPDLSVTTDLPSPAVVTGPLSFNVTFTSNSNAKTMIMWDPLVGLTGGTISGQGSAYNLPTPSTGPLIHKVTLTFTPPDFAWTSMNVTSSAWSHWPDDDQYRTGLVNQTWNFVNGVTREPEAKESPALSALAPFIAIAAFVAGRRRLGSNG